MQQIKRYIQETLGTDLNPEPIPQKGLSNLPLYIREAFKLYYATLHNHDLILAEPKHHEPLSILQTTKQLHQLQTAFNKNVVLIAEDITAINRKRFIESGINFIVAGKQMYLPDLLIDLREIFNSKKNKHRNGNYCHLHSSSYCITCCTAMRKRK